MLVKTDTFPGPDEHPIDLQARFAQYLRAAYPAGVEEQFIPQIRQAFVCGIAAATDPRLVHLAAQTMEYTKNNRLLAFRPSPIIVPGRQ